MFKKQIAFLGCTNFENTLKFYNEQLGLDLVVKDDFAVVFKSGNGLLRITKFQSVSPPDGTALGWTVENIQSGVDLITDAGITFEFFEEVPQDKKGISTFPNGDKVAWFKDPDGNMLSITEGSN